MVFRNRLDNDAKNALYRIAQEALTNVERHSGATHVTVDLRGHIGGATLRISDNGSGIPQEGPHHPRAGLGLRNMQERAEQLEGTLRIFSTRSGTAIVAEVPLSHILTPEEASPDKRKASA